MAQLNTQDPNLLSYEHEILRVEVPGGVKLEGLDRMRVTLKVELKDSPRPPVRHNLDLYNDNQLEKFIRKVAERMEIGTSVIAASLSQLTSEIEKYRLEQIKQQEIQAIQVKQLTEEEQKTAKENLQTENLMQQTIEDLQSTGIQGEENNSMILLLAMSSRKLHDPLSVLCLARSGTGKSYLMEKVALCIPAEDTREQTQFTGASFYHFKREEIKGKVFLIEDLHGAQAVMFPIAELQTKKRISKTMTIKDKSGQLRTVTLIVEGPVSVIGCTTQEKIYEDNANRAILIYLDGSKEQDERIMNYQKQLRAGLTDWYKEKQTQEKLQNMQRMLQPVRVINPYAPLIDLPKEIFKPRRTLPILLSFIEAITFYCQYQREAKADETTGEIYIETHPTDIEWAFKLLKDVLFRKGDELSGVIREFYQWVVSHRNQLEKKTGFYANDIRKINSINPRTLNRYLQELTDYGLLQIVGGNKHRSGYAYKIIAGKDFSELQSSIETQIKRVIENVWKAYEQRGQKPGGLLSQSVRQEQEKPKSTKKKTSKPVSQELDKAIND
jgi:DNA-binding HxlR family transcriptional regulator